MGLQETFEFRAQLDELDQGLDSVHGSLEAFREITGRPADDARLMLFEIALGEIGGNVLTHGRPKGHERPVEYELRYRDGALEAFFTDGGPPAFEHLEREMPGHDSEEGRGIALARSVLDGFDYTREGDLNRWRLVKRL